MAQVLIKELREKRGLTVEELSEETGIPLERICSLESGTEQIKYEDAGLLGKVLDIDPTHLIESAKTINYNLGTYSRTIYAEKYCESDEKER